MSFYTYIIIDEQKELPIYVGKGKNSRANVHLQKSHNVYLDRKIKKMIRSENYPQIVKIHTNSEKEAFDLETKLISEFGRADLGLGPLINQTDGGEGNAGRIITKEHRDKLAKANLGKTASIETKTKMALARLGKPSPNLGKTASIETRKKLSEAGKKRTHSEETRRKK